MRYKFTAWYIIFFPFTHRHKIFNDKATFRTMVLIIVTHPQTF